MPPPPRHFGTPLPLPESGDVPWAMLERVAEAQIAIDQTVLVLKAADDG
jgi:hypothetical protein